MRIVLVVLALFIPLPGVAQEAADKLPLLFADDFDKGADRWQPTDPAAWKIDHVGKNAFFSQFQASNYKPPHRSPFNIALVKDLHVADFILTAKCQSTVKDYGHRDLCLFFGYQDPAHFYYVHLGKKADDRANQIFIVNKADRKKISLTSTAGTDWTDGWHQVKVKHAVGSGLIEVFFDDMTKPVMTAKDKTFAWGQVGVGCFDDTGNWDDVKLFGEAVKK